MHHGLHRGRQWSGLDILQPHVLGIGSVLSAHSECLPDCLMRPCGGVPKYIGPLSRSHHVWWNGGGLVQRRYFYIVPSGIGVYLSALLVSHGTLTHTCAPVPPPFCLYVGYTTNAQGGGNTSFVVTCLASGAFSDAEQCLIINCGSPPNVPHAQVFCDIFVQFV